MIFDRIKNISKYSGIPKEVLDFIANLSEDIECGKHVINDDAYASVEIYNTKLPVLTKMEAHKKYIDLQLLLRGLERVNITEKSKLDVDKDYDELKDIVFYKHREDCINTVYLDGSNFVMLFPNEAHEPQISPNVDCNEVKKVVVKIKAD